MRLTKETLRQVIKEVKEERRKDTMILSEMAEISKYDKIIAALEGQTAEVNTVGIMSAQNPMAQAVSAEENAQRAAALEAELAKRALDYDRIGGMFGGNPEDSVLIYNPQRAAMDELNDMFNQWGYVWGQRKEMAGPQDIIIFTMYMRENPGNPYAPDPNSRQVERVQKHDEMASAMDYSFEPESGKRFGLNFYGPETK